MPELFVRDIFDQYKDEIESDFQKILEIAGISGPMQSAYFVGTLQRVARKIYMRYGQRIVSYENAKYAEEILYHQLLQCTKELQQKYFRVQDNFHLKLS